MQYIAQVLRSLIRTLSSSQCRVGSVVLAGFVALAMSTAPAAGQSISSFAPESGTPGTSVTIHGDGFSSTAGDNTVEFGGTAATVTSASATRLVVTVPSGVTGLVDLSVTVGGTTVTATQPFAGLKANQGARAYTDIGAGLDSDLNRGEFEWVDYDGDGDLDLFAAANGNTIVYRNSGGDTFAKLDLGIISVNNGASVDWGDYDNDGDLDVVVSGYNGSVDSTVTRIYQNDGSGNFTWLQAGITGVDRSAVKWGDYDQDGDLDLVVAGYDKNDTPITRIYRNDGSDFTAVGAGLEGIGEAALDWGDYDADGDLDLVVAGRNGSVQTLLYRNDGGGSFAEVTTDLPGVFNGAAEWGDYNEDGKPDLLLVGRGGQDDIFRNEGSGVFTGINAGLPDLGQASNWKEPDAQWGDADGDGDLDVLLGGGTSTGPKTDVYRNEGDTSFVATDSGLIGLQRAIVAWGDYDGDGDLDLAVGGRDKAARIYRSDGDGSPWQPRTLIADEEVGSVDLNWTRSPSEDVAKHNIYRSTSPIDSTAGPSGMSPVATVDTPSTTYTDQSVAAGTKYYYRVTAVDGDDLESGFSRQFDATPKASELTSTSIAPTSGTPGTTVRIYGFGFDSSPSSNTVQFGSKEATVTGATSTRLVVEVPSGVSGSVKVSVQAGGNSYTSTGRFSVLDQGLGARKYTDIGAGLDQNLNQGEFEWADYEHDGDLDLLVAAQNRTTIYQNAGGDVFGKVNIGIPGVRNGSSADWGDYDGDGDLDIVVSGYSRKLGKVITRIYQNKGDGTFQWLKAGLTGVDRSTVKWGDYDQDGDLDLVVSGNNEQDNPITRIYRNDGTDFTAIGAGVEGLAGVAVDWGDYDSDGDLDLVLSGRGTSDLQTLLYRNDGGGTFTEVSTNLPGGVQGMVQWGDYNEDGRPDLLLVGGGVQEEVFRNEGSGVFTGIDAGLPNVEGRPDGRWGDADGDGDLDVLLSGVASTGELTDVYRNEGDTSFVATESGLIGMERSIVAWGDYDSDGDLDLAVGGRDKAARIYRSDGDASPWKPRGLTASGGVKQVDLDWTASPSEDRASYRIYRSTSPIDSTSGPSNLTPIDNVSAPTTSYTDNSVTANTQYYYRVTAVDAAGLESGTSNQADATPRVSNLAITGFQAESAAPGTSIQIFGREFGASPSDNTVTFGGAEATVLEASSTKLTVKVPSGETGGVDLSVTTNGVTVTAAQSFTVLTPTQGRRTYTDIGAGLDQNLNQGEFEWADFDDDGDLDLLAASKQKTTIYQNAGGDVFGKVNTGIIGVGNGASADWGDYDSDGDLDLAVSGYNGNVDSVVTRIYQNDGSGNFTWLQAGLTGVDRSAIKWGDYDQDGDLDLVVAGYNKQDNPITRIYRNDGTDFTALGAELEGVGDAVLDWGDYDSDGDLDLIISGSGSDVVTKTVLYRNDGGGTFAKVSTDLPGSKFGTAQWGDYNEDGRPDLLLVGSNVQDDIYRNDGSGVFTPINAGLPDVEGRPDGQWGDADGDGDLDVLIGGVVSSGEITGVYRNEGDTSFVKTGSGLIGTERSIVAWGDYDSDGDLDLAVGGRDKTARIYRSDGDGSPWKPRNLAVTSEIRNVDLSWTASPSEDGDVIGYNIYRNTSAIDSSAGPSGLTPVATVDTPATSFTDTGIQIGTQYHYRVAALDSSDLESGFTAEVTATPVQPLAISSFTPTSGAPDTSVTVYGSGFSTTASENTVTFGSEPATVTSATRTTLTVTVPSGTVGPVSLTVQEGGETATAAARFTRLQPRTTVRSLTATDVGLNGLSNSSVALGDLNGDNFLDIAVVGETGTGTPAARLYTNNGDGTYTQMDAGLTGVSNGSVAIGDFNGDNFLDVLIAGTRDDGTPVTKLYQNDGSGSFSATNANLAGVSNGSVAIGDLNGDNFLDVVVTGTNGNEVPITRLYAGDGTGSFTAMNAGLANLTNGSVEIGDLNGDNFLDVAIVGEQSDGTPTARLYQNDGSGSFSVLASLTGVTNGSVALGDLNGDNFVDIATVGEESGGTPITKLYAGDGTGSFSAMDAGLTGVTNGAVALGDLNGDNFLDVAIAGTNQGGDRVLEVYRNASDGWVSVGPGPITGVPTHGGMNWSDGDSDGDLDLMAFGAGIGTEDPPTALVYENVYPTPRGLTAEPGTNQADLSWDETAGSQLQGYDVYRSTAPIDSLGGLSSMEPVGSVGASTTSFTDETLDEGQTYYYRVTAKGSTGETSPPSAQTYAFLYPETVEASVSRSFGDASSGEDYRLVALPGAVSRKLGETVSGEAGTEWQAWWDNGTDSDFFVRFDGSETFEFERGRGFWLTATQDWTVDDSISTVTLQKDTAATIPLNDGWTIVSNPFDKPVDWPLVEAANGGDLQSLWAFEGAFRTTSSFGSAASGQAYYFFNDTGRDSLMVPYPGAPLQTEASKDAESEGSETGEPLLALSATPAETEGPSSTVRLGLAEAKGAEEAVVAPPAQFSAVSLRIEAEADESASTAKQASSSDRSQLLMSSRRVVEGEGETFTVQLDGQTDGPVRLSASNLDARTGNEVVLLDPSAGATYDLRSEGHVTLEVGDKTRRLKVAVGSKQYVEQEKSQVLPNKVRLTSYPNPIGQQGTLEYALPEETDVTLRVYDVLGREVATLQQGRKEAGRHTVRLSTDGLSSGVYFGRLTAGDRTLTQKITVVR